MSEAVTKSTVMISNLEKPLVRGTVSSKYDIARFEKVARSDPADLPAIRVGVVNDRYYPMNRLDVLEACKLTSLREINVEISNYESKLDLMVTQMRNVSVGELIDPLKIRGIMDEFGILGMPVDDALKTINLNDTALGLIAKCQITDDVLGMFAKFIEAELSDKLASEVLTIPTYIILRLSRLEPDMQKEIARLLIELTPPGSRMNFAWPAPAAVVHRIKNTPKPEIPEEPVCAEPVNPDDSLSVVPKKNAGAHPSKKKQKTKPVENDTLKDILRVAKDCIVGVNKKGYPTMLVHKKHNTINKVSAAAAGKAFKLHENIGKPAYLLPLVLDKHLELESRSLQCQTFDNIEDLVRFAKTIEGDNIKCSMLWTAE